ncbi:MAG: nucleotidyltransferase domain-containing protein [Nanoarchaeota archaeon]
MVHLRYNRIEGFELDELEINIISYLFSEPAHIRKIEREIGISHSTILRKIGGMEKKGLIDYLSLGRNKQYFVKKTLRTRKVLEIVESFKVFSLLKKHPFLEPLFMEMLKKCDSKMIILFGSYAKGISKEESDIDIYVETDNVHVKKRLEEINSKISVKVGDFDTNSLLIKEIIKNHIVLRGADRFYEQVFG